MTPPQSSFGINVDVVNPGQAIACCGVLELAHRLWPGAEGSFEDTQFLVAIPERSDDNALNRLVTGLASCEISGLSKEERDERERLEKESRELKKSGAKLPPDKERRRGELGERARAGRVRIGPPFDLALDWWRTGDDEASPKTWAGLQELHRIARAAQDALPREGDTDLTALLEFHQVLRQPQEYRKERSDSQAVEPFYFDARRFAHRLDVGFSIDALELETAAYPAVEILSLIGLQRFRPAAAPDQRRSFDYWIWRAPLPVAVAAAVFSGVAPIPHRQGYRFPLRFRDDQKRYKAFGFATPMGGDR
jgi:CRISPR-associated protein Csb3